MCDEILNAYEIALESLKEYERETIKEQEETKEDYKKLCIKEPNLIIRTPEFFAEDVASNAELLKMSKEDFVSLARKNPFLLTKRFNNIREIEVLMNKKNS